MIFQFLIKKQVYNPAFYSSCKVCF